METNLFNEFLMSGDTLHVYQDKKLLFASDKDRLLPLLEYIDRLAPYHQGVAIFDKIMGNAAALLSIKASCRKVYSPLGSELASKTLSSYDIEYHLTEMVPHIQNVSGDMCPMEKLSLNKNPEEFYQVVRHYYR